MTPDLAPVLEALMDEMTDANTIGFILGGSHARGEATAHSDVDVRRYVRAPVEARKRYLMRGGFLFEYSTHPISLPWESLRNPARAIWHVPMLRQARILRDTDGEIAALKRGAEAFTWEPLQPAADAHASYALHMTVETIFKTINGFGSPEVLARNLFWLTEPITELVAVQRGVLFESSRTYLNQIRAAMGRDSDWTRFHCAAFDPRLPVEDRALAGLRLFVETARLLDPILTAEDQAVIGMVAGRVEAFLVGR